MERYVAFRVAGPLRRWTRVGRLAAGVRDGERGSELRLRTYDLALKVAELLGRDVEGSLPRASASDSPFRRYEDVVGEDGFAVIWRTERGIDSRPIGRTRDVELARTVTKLLNRVDPHVLRVPRSWRVVNPWW